MIRAPARVRSSGARVFTVAWVPTGMKTGVGTGPRGVQCPFAHDVAVVRALDGVWRTPALARVSRQARSTVKDRLTPVGLVGFQDSGRDLLYHRIARLQS
jgi:hypothetical protein